MSVNKYVGDYRLLEEIDEHSHITTTTEYIGDDYFYELAEQPRKKDAAIVVVAVLAFAVGVLITVLIQRYRQRKNEEGSLHTPTE